VSADEDPIRSDDCAANAAPYVLGALGEAEYDAFRTHLETCAICREEVAALQLVADALPAVAPPLSAPEELKRRVMAEVRSEAGWQRSRAPATSSPRARRRWLAPSIAAAAAAVALAVIAIGGGGTSVRVIHAQVLAPHASASLRLTGGHAELDIAGMPQTPVNRVYEVWVKRGSSAQPTDALFTITSAGRATVGVPGSVAGAEAVLVTSEPLGGSRVPTRAPVIIANLS